MKKIFSLLLLMMILSSFANLIAEDNPALREGSEYKELTYTQRKTHHAPSFWHLLKQELPQGINHIFTGIDHLAFIIALALMMMRMRQLIIVVTYFTAAHALTLTLYSFDIIKIGKLGVSIIEILVAVSIMWVGLENLYYVSKNKLTGKRILNVGNKEKESMISTQKRSLVAFLFGLVHGVAFSEHFRSALVEYDFNNFTHVLKLLFAVLSFNIGVDIAQIAVAFVVFFALYAIEKYVTPASLSVALQKKIILYTSALISILGAGWIVQRIMEL